MEISSHRHRAHLLWATTALALLCSGSCRRDRSQASSATGSAVAARTHQLTLITYNVHDHPQDAKLRTPPLLRILQAADADIIALQEVAPWFLRTLKRQPWTRRYHYTPVGAGDRPPGGLLILSRFRVQRTLVATLPGPLKRKALLADLRVDGHTLAVVNCQLERPLKAGPVRASQLEMVFPLLQHATDAILLGDLAFGDKEEPETKKIPKAYKDLWYSLRKDTPGYTWDNERSPMAADNALPGEPSRRVDRILWRSTLWRPHTIRILGTQPVAPDKPGLFPSDHFGLLGVLQR